MDTRSRSKAKLIDTEVETDIELEEQEYVTHHQDDLSGSEEIEDDGELEVSATDEGEIEPSVRPRRPTLMTHLHHPLSPASRIPTQSDVRHFRLRTVHRREAFYLHPHPHKWEKVGNLTISLL